MKGKTMSVKHIVVKGEDECLNAVCHPVTKFDRRLHRLIEDMKATLLEENGVGLAAPQIGILRRIAIIEVEEGKVYELINPKIVAYAGEQIEREGCLSNPGAMGYTKRPRAVTVRATNRHGEEYELRGTDLLARAICHECDHLDGKLYTDVEVKSPKGRR